MEDEERESRLQVKLAALRDEPHGEAVIMYAAFCRCISSTPTSFQHVVAPIVTHMVMRLLGDDPDDVEQFFAHVQDLLRLTLGLNMMLVLDNVAQAVSAPSKISTDSALQASLRLTDWEQEFLSSLRSRIEMGLRPTLRQVETLDTVWEKATQKG
jgi:hypothetical protein